MQDVPDPASAFNHIWGLGYHRLVPIIPPDAPLHPDSGMAKRAARGKDPRGKAPGVLRHGGWSGFDWVRHESTAEDTARWAAQGAGVGIKLGHGLVAIDIDVLDADLADRIEREAVRALGPAPCRIGRFPKRLLVYLVEGDLPYRKLRLKDGQAVEVLTEGRQFVAAGVHPVTGEPYEWTRPLVARDKLFWSKSEQVDALLDELAEMLGGEVYEGHEASTDAPPQDQLTGDPELVAKAVNALPNRDADYPTRDDWLRVGYAIKAAFGPDHEDEALDCFHQWSARWDAGSTDPDDLEAEWARMKPPYRAGASWLYEEAERLGGWQGRALEFFKPVSGATGAPEKRTTYELLTVDDILHLPAPVWLLQRHIPESGLGFLYGRPGCGKSFVALDMALHMAYGLEEWHGDTIRTPIGVPQPTILYIASEGVSGFKGRVGAWLRSRMLPEDANRFYLIRESINFMKAEDVGKLVETARSAGLPRVDLTIVDTVSRALPGADENLQKDMTLFVSACDAVRLALGGGVLGVHHAGKSGDMRGSTVLLGAGDYVLRLDRKEGETVGALRCEKQKDGPDGWEDSYAFLPVSGSLVVSRVEGEAPVGEVDVFG